MGISAVISVSRRCDIPRFAFDWFLEKLDAGFVEVKNPFNSSQFRRISMLPGEAKVFAFWTRDPSRILHNAENLRQRGLGFYVMTTLTAYPGLLESNTPAAEDVIKTMKELSKKTSPDRVIWRYDPVFLSNITDFGFHRSNFANLAAALNGCVNRVIVSVYDRYAKAEKRLLRLESEGALKSLDYSAEQMRELLSEMAAIAGKEGMEIQSCAEDPEDCGIRPGACIDSEYIKKQFGLEIRRKDPGQKRPGCLCGESADIGSYGHCPAGCVYCFASL